MKDLEKDPEFAAMPEESKIIITKALKNIMDAKAQEEDPAGTINFVIRHDKPKVVYSYEKQKYSAKGVIDTPLRYIEKRVELFDQYSSTLLVDRDKMTLSLTTDEQDYFAHNITGALQMHPDYLKFNINDSTTFEPKQLGKFFRMNRAAFDDLKTNQALVALLMNFEAKVDATVEEKIGTNGDRRKVQDQVVKSNIPDSFFLTLPIFKGQPPVRFKVEVIVSPDTLKCELESPEATEFIDKVKNSAIDEQIASIKAIAPNLLIIEQ